MSLHTSPQRHVPYHLVPFGPEGIEREEPSGERASDALINGAQQDGVTDVFIFSHGWNGDVSDATRQYGNWLDAMAECVADRQRLKERKQGFKPLLVGLHWPSKPWGDENLGDVSFAVSARDDDAAVDPVQQVVDEYAAILGDDPKVRDAITRIVEVDQREPVPPRLPAEARDAYDELNSHLQIESEGEGAAPGDDRGPFDPNQVYQALLIAEMAEPVAFGGFSLSGVLGPLRFLSFWTMKQRAMLFGQSGAADLLTKLREARKQARFHLTGHSFGCIVMSATVAGPPDAGFDEPRADSLVLIQGAMSLWSFCNRIPDRPDRSGYFRRVVDNELVSGPVLATTSLHDKAVRVLYPLAAGVLDQISFGAPGKLPTYGGIGTFGVRGPGIETVDDELHTIDVDYTFRPHVTYNLNCNNVISQTKGLSGAHSDICHPELAHAVFRAADALRP